MTTIRGQLAEAFAALRDALRNDGIRRIEFAYFGASLGFAAQVVVVSVYAYRHGGATAVALVMFARLIAAAVAAPFTATLADRHDRRRVMLVSDLARAAVLALTAVAAGAGSPAVVYVLSVLASVIGSAFRPAEAALVPQLAQTPEELSAANVTSSTFDSTAAFAGPAAGALLLALGGASLGFAAIAVSCLWSASFVVRIPRPERGERPQHEAHDEGEGLLAGIRTVRSEPRLRLVMALYGAQAAVAGAYGVLVVVIALELLDLGNAGVGYLEAASGVGALLGATLALLLAQRRRIATDFALGLVCFGAPLLAVAALPRTWAALVALLVLGLGNSLVDVSAITLLQRSTPPAVTGRVFGVLDAGVIGALGIGSIATPLLVHLLGVRGALVAVGAVLPILAVVTRRALAEADRGAAVPEEQLAAISVVPFLDVLPLQRKEALAAALERVQLAAGTTLFSEGQPGDQLYILTEGTIEIDLPSGPKVETAPAFVGEIALLRDVPRTATVRITEDATLWALDGAAFLDAVVGHGRSRSAADAVVASRGVALGV